MGKFDISPPDELIRALERMANVDKVAPKMLLAGIEPVEKKIKQGARKHIATGQMADSVVHNKPKQNKDGWICSVTFKGKDKETGVRNGQKAFVNEYGKKGQQPTPFVRPAIITSEKQALQAMQDVYEFETQLNNIKV